MNYQEAITYLESFVDYEKIDSYSYQEVIKLERIRELLTYLGNPHQKIKFP